MNPRAVLCGGALWCCALVTATVIMTGVSGCSGGRTALVRAAEQGDVQATQAVIAKGVDKPQLAQAFSVAVEKGNAAVAGVLLEHGATPNGEHLLSAALNGQADLVALLVRYHANVEYQQTVYRIMAIGRVNGVQTLVPDEATFADGFYHYTLTERSEGRNPLFVAVEGGHAEVVRLLLEAGAKPNVKCICKAQIDIEHEFGYVSPFMDTTITGTYKGEKAYWYLKTDGLIKTTVPPNKEEISAPLIAAVKKGDARIVRLLLDNGADIRIADSDGLTALDHAKATGNQEISALLQK